MVLTPTLINNLNLLIFNVTEKYTVKIHIKVKYLNVLVHNLEDYLISDSKTYQTNYRYNGNLKLRVKL